MWADHYFGKCLRLLSAMPLWEDAVLLLIGDHGEEFGERGESGHGKSLFPETTRVPFVVQGPARVGPARVVTVRTSVLDVAPTVIALAGLPAVESFEGRDVITTIDDEALFRARPLFLHLVPEALRAKKSVAADTSFVGEVNLLSDKWKLRLRDYGTRSVLVRELYDLSADPAARKNVVREFPTVVGELERVVRSWWRSEACHRTPATGSSTIPESTLRELQALGYLN
jgi:arylsulfatase A-like enzyme